MLKKIPKKIFDKCGAFLPLLAMMSFQCKIEKREPEVTLKAEQSTQKKCEIKLIT